MMVEFLGDNGVPVSVPLSLILEMRLVTRRDDDDGLAHEGVQLFTVTLPDGVGYQEFDDASLTWAGVPATDGRVTVDAGRLINIRARFVDNGGEVVTLDLADIKETFISRKAEIFRDTDHNTDRAALPEIDEDTEYHFADVLNGRDDAKRLEKYEYYFGFGDVDKQTQGLTEAWSLAKIRFTDLPEGVLWLRPHDRVWYDETSDSSDIIRLWDGDSPPHADLSDGIYLDRRVRRDRDDRDVEVAENQEILLADIDRLVFIPPEDFHGTFTLNYQVFDGQDWSGTKDGTGSAVLQFRVTPVADGPEPVTEALPVTLFERDEDFGNPASDDNRDALDTPQALSEYALRATHFGAILPGHADSMAVYFDTAALAAAGARIEVYNKDTALWGLPGSHNHLGDDHVAGTATGQVTVGLLRDGHVRLRYDAVHDPDAVLDFVHTLNWGFADNTLDQTAVIRPDHIRVLEQKHFGVLFDNDKEHDAHDLVITLTLPGDPDDGTIQVWDGSVWSTPADADSSAGGHQLRVTVEQLEDGFVRFVHGGGEGGDLAVAWVVTDGVAASPIYAGSLNIAVTPVNDRPVSGDILRVIDEDTTQQFSKSEIPFEDVDTDLQSVKIMSITYGAGLGGTLKINDRILKEGDFISADEIDSLTFTPDADRWDTVTLKIPAGQVWQRYDGTQWVGYEPDAFTDLNTDDAGEVTISWSDLARLRIKDPADRHTTVTLRNMGTYFDDPSDPGATIDHIWLNDKAAADPSGEGWVKVSAKDNVVISVYELNEQTGQRVWQPVYDVTADNRFPPAHDGIQAFVRRDDIVAGRVRVHNTDRVLTLDDLRDASNWNMVTFTLVHPDDGTRTDYDPRFLTDEKITIPSLAAFGVTQGVYDGTDFDLNILASDRIQDDIGTAVTAAEIISRGGSVSATYQNGSYAFSLLISDAVQNQIGLTVDVATLKATNGVTAAYNGTAFTLADYDPADINRKVKLSELQTGSAFVNATYDSHNFGLQSYDPKNVGRVVTLKDLKKAGVTDGMFNSKAFVITEYLKVWQDKTGVTVTLTELTGNDKKYDVIKADYKGTAFDLRKYDPDDVNRPVSVDTR